MNVAADYESRCMEGSDIQAHLPTLYAFGTGARRVIELGVRSGNSTAAFLAACEAGGGHLWSVDIEDPAVPPEWLNTGLWDLLIGDDLDLVDNLPDEVDVVFIDTIHTYAHTMAELLAYGPKVRPGGVILCHDTELDHPPTDPGPPEFPVAAAITEWTTAMGWDVEWHRGCYGLGVLRKPEAA